VSTLRSLLSEHPELIDQRSTRAHRAPLLHYVTANGVEDYRQLSPGNAVDVARILLDAGARVDATSDAYGGQSTALGLVATSTPPRRAGVQLPLIDLLLERGAAIDGVKAGASTVASALANNCPEAAAVLADRGAVVDVISAAGLGRLALLARLAERSTKDQLERALIMAARHGTYDVLEYLLDLGVDVGAFDGMTALHHAAARAKLDRVRLLLRHGAPLEKENAYGGSVLSSTLWFANHSDPSDVARRDYAAVIDALVAAGARTDGYPGMRADIEEIYRLAGR
jgi:hypothetical protein